MSDTTHELCPRFRDHAILGLLTPEIESLSDGTQGDTTYSWQEVNEIPDIECITLLPDKLYAAKLLDENGITIHFALFEWHTEDDDGVRAVPFWYGYGTGGALKELRHSYFAEDGYIFYADMKCFRYGAAWLETVFED